MSAQNSLDALLQISNSESIPHISVDELQKLRLNDTIILLDAREPKEFEVSHIADAIFVGYNKFSSEEMVEKITDKKAPIIVYCSIGVRSEDIGEKLEQLGFDNVKNLHGGIFEWKNKGYPVVDSEEKETEKVHAYSRLWGKWLNKGIKVYD